MSMLVSADSAVLSNTDDIYYGILAPFSRSLTAYTNATYADNVTAEITLYYKFEGESYSITKSARATKSASAKASIDVNGSRTGGSSHHTATFDVNGSPLYWSGNSDY